MLFITEFKVGTRLYKSACLDKLFASVFGCILNIALPSSNMLSVPYKGWTLPLPGRMRTLAAINSCSGKRGLSCDHFTRICGSSIVGMPKGPSTWILLMGEVAFDTG